MWTNWEQLQCVVHSPLIVGMTIALLFSLGTCHVQIQSVQVDYACTKRLFNLSVEAIIDARNARLCVRCAYSFWRSKKFFFLVAWSRSLHFWREHKISSRCYFKMSIVLASIVPTETNANLLEVMSQLRDSFMVVESVEPGCLFKKILLCYKGT